MNGLNAQRAALAAHARAGSDEVLLASWIALHRQLSGLGPRRAAPLTTGARWPSGWTPSRTR